MLSPTCHNRDFSLAGCLVMCCWLVVCWHDSSQAALLEPTRRYNDIHCRFHCMYGTAQYNTGSDNDRRGASWLVGWLIGWLSSTGWQSWPYRFAQVERARCVFRRGRNRGDSLTSAWARTTTYTQVTRRPHLPITNGSQIRRLGELACFLGAPPPKIAFGGDK